MEGSDGTCECTDDTTTRVQIAKTANKVALEAEKENDAAEKAVEEPSHPTTSTA